MISKAAMDRALGELRQKTMRQIQAETAATWAARACAAQILRRSLEAREFAQEAIEHAALSGDDRLLGLIRQAFAEHGIGY